MTVSRIKLIRWIIGGVAGVLVGLWIAVLVVSRAPILREKLIAALSQQLDADVELGSLEVRTFPILRIHGDNLKLRLKKQNEPANFIEVSHFEVSGGILGILHRRRRFGKVELTGLRITIPPRTPHDREVGAKAASTIVGPVLIDRIVSTDAELIIVPRDPSKAPHVFAIHHLQLDSVGFNRAMPFEATLSNPIPKGEIETTGSFGPWIAGDPGSTQVTGRFTFNHADLSTIPGIGGVLNAAGDFSGRLVEIDVRGTTTMRDFQLEEAGSPVPLDTRFHAVVDGTDGNTYLKSVDAKFLGTTVTASGDISRTPGAKGRTVRLDVAIKGGQVQDVLQLVVRAPRPVMVGTIALQSTLLLPSGPARAAERLQLDGRFVVERARFTDTGVQEKMVTLSRHGQGKTGDEPIGRVLSNMRGRFVVRGGEARFEPLAFDVPGAEVQLTGNYGLRNQHLSFSGTVAMQASISEVAGGGIRGFFLKPFNPLFRRKGAGALLPFTITGSRSDPKFGLDWKKALTRK